MRAQRRSLLLFLLFTYLCLFAESVYSARYLVLRIIGHALPALRFGPRLVGPFRRCQGFVNSSRDLPMMVWLGIALVAAFLGLSPRFSLERIWLYFGYSLGFYALLELEAQDPGTSTFRALFMTGAMVCVLGLFEWLGRYLGRPLLPDATVGWPMTGSLKTLVPPILYRLNATLGGSTPLAAFLTLLIPTVIGWMLTIENTQAHWALGLQVGWPRLWKCSPSPAVASSPWLSRCH